MGETVRDTVAGAVLIPLIVIVGVTLSVTDATSPRYPGMDKLGSMVRLIVANCEPMTVALTASVGVAIRLTDATSVS